MAAIIRSLSRHSIVEYSLISIVVCHEWKQNKEKKEKKKKKKKKKKKNRLVTFLLRMFEIFDFFPERENMID